VPDLQTVGRFMLLTGVAIAIVGILLIAGAKLGLGSLPGDIRIQGEKWSFYVPLATMLLVSLVLTLLINIVWRWFK
jgi:hypothetical protein